MLHRLASNVRESKHRSLCARFFDSPINRTNLQIIKIKPTFFAFSVLALSAAQAILAPAIKAENVGERNDRPNVVLIMTDDQGYGDLSITKNEAIETPNMDRIASEGAWLKQFYVSPVCTPTRAHLMTGRYGFRTRAIDTYLGRAVMEPDEVTIPEVLGKAGYATGIFGKWHLGDYFPTRAIDQGFDEAVVHQGGGLRQPANPPLGDRYHDPILFQNGEPKRFEGYCTDIFFDEAIKFIEKKTSQGKPFFTYISTNAPHGPFDEPPTRGLMEQFQAKFPKNKNQASFYAMVKNVDDNIGRLLAKLEQLNIDDNTVVIFLTDNGPSAGSAGPFRGKKGSVYQGGIRTVCFIRWPNAIEPGSSTKFTTAHIDLMPSILDICDVAVPEGIKLDGRSVRPLLAEKGITKAAAWPDRHLFFQWHRGNTPLRYHHFAAIDPQGKWKLLHRSNPGKHKFDNPPKFELFNLQNDIAETKNLANQRPEIVKELKQAYDEWFDDVCNTRQPNFGMPPIAIGSQKQNTVVLTPQDKRSDTPLGGWYVPGYWPIDVQQNGPFTIKVLLDREVSRDTKINLNIKIGDQQISRSLTVFRGVDTAIVGGVELPATGLGRVTATVESDDKEIPNVYQITIK